MLKDITIPKKEVSAGEVSFEVRGLTLTDITELLEDHREAITDLFNGRRNMADMLQECPLLAARMIAHAAEERDQVEVTQRLPAGLQLIALETLWDLTVPDEESLGKVIVRVANAISEIVGEEAAQKLRGISEQESPAETTTGSPNSPRQPSS